MSTPELAAIAATLEQFPFPKKITFELCSECNLQCPMCYQPSMARTKGVMPFELWQRCADEIAATSPDTECWFSFCGEPLLYPDLLCRILSYGKSLGLRSLNVNTNGMLLTPAVADRLLSTGVDTIVVGIDGFSADVYETVRLGGKRDELYRNVEYLLEARTARAAACDVQVQFIEMDENAHEAEAFKKHWLSKGAVVKHRAKLSWGGRIDTPLDVPQAMRIPCPWIVTLMHVFWDGRIPRCPGDTEGTDCVGSVWNDTLRTLWARLAPHRQTHLDYRFDELPERCQSCKDWMTGAAHKIRS